MKKIIIFFTISLLVFGMLSGCKNQERTDKLENLHASEIEEIKCSGNTGGQDGSFAYSMTESKMKNFVDLLNQVKLGNTVDQSEALSTGAVVYYNIRFTNGETLKISPGKYFMVGDTYYEFENYDELWESFVEFNSSNTSAN